MDTTIDEKRKRLNDVHKKWFISKYQNDEVFREKKKKQSLDRYYRKKNELNNK